MQLQRIRLGLVAIFSLVLSLGAGAQDNLDITAAKADPITRIFDDNRNTVAGYVYYVLEKESRCCGNDAIYLEVRIRPDGTVESARALTGSNKCIQKSVVDILKDIKWEASGFTQTKPIYFEIKPALRCSGPDKDNEYIPLTLVARQARAAGTAVATTAQQPAAAQPVSTQPMTVTAQPTATSQPATQPAAKPTQTAPAQQPAAQPVTTATAQPKPATQPVEQPKPTTPAVQPATTTPAAQPQQKPAEQPKPTTPPATQPATTTAARNTPASQTPATQPANQTGVAGNVAVAAPRYVSAGDRKPDASHQGSSANMSGPRATTPEFVEGETMLALYIKRELRKANACGFAHVLAEVTVEKDGTVSAVRVFRANSKQVLDAISPILAGLKYKPETLAFRQNVYIEFKADVDCPGNPGRQTNLDQVPSFLKTDNSQ